MPGLAIELIRRLARRGRRNETYSVTEMNAGAVGGYYGGLNEHLLHAVPENAMAILEVGCSEGRLGEAVRGQRPGRRVYGVELEPAAAAHASARLDRVFCIDAIREVPDLDPGSLDLLLFGDVLEHLVDPAATLRRYATFLRPEGRILCSVPNVGHHSIITSLARGEWQYKDAGLLDATHLRFFTRAGITKLLLDAGFAPMIRDSIEIPPPRRLRSALKPLQDHARANQPLNWRDLAAYQWIIEGTLLHWESTAPELPLTFIACVNDDVQLADNLAASGCFKGPVPHQLVAVRGARSAAEGLEIGRQRARHDIMILLHQDIYLPDGWPARFFQQWHAAEELVGAIGVAGVYGASYDSKAKGSTFRAGHVMDRDTMLCEPPALPARVETLDEIVLALRRDSPLRLDPALGWHFYGADLGLQARQAGLAAVALDAPCFHNSLCGRVLDGAFYRSRRIFRSKWRRELPLATSCTVVS